ncbi:Ceramide kinase-like protein [Bagarius yarrelli]|uniref:Ceramide kinase-like protein n=1 Tax=Bagarius yarrelli TaxID=175774 RepID=A0A556V1G8_BAGYA|nr:Ceramide kinase-like protein [Bagarius yarrelli]
MDAERDTHSSFTPVPAPLPLGVIPAGHRQPVDVCSLSSMGSLLRFGFCAMVGFGGQVLAVAERLNWIPSTQRHELALITALAQLRPEEFEFSFIASSTKGSDHTQTELEEDSSDVAEDSEWQVRRGLYLSMTITSIPCLCSVAPKGFAPFTRLANNSMALTAVANTSRSEFIKHLKRFSSSNNPKVKSRLHTRSPKMNTRKNDRNTKTNTHEALERVIRVVPEEPGVCVVVWCRAPGLETLHRFSQAAVHLLPPSGYNTQCSSDTHWSSDF